MVLPVKVEDRTIKKPYLGGWRNKITGIEYLNAVSQTGPPPKRLPWHCQCSRKTQSVETKEQISQSLYDRATQMWREDCYVPSVSDKYMTAKPYETYDGDKQLRLNVDGCARTIQRYYKAYRMYKYVKECAARYRKIKADCERYKQERAINYRMRHQHEILRKTYPQTRADFDMLYNLIDQWRLARLNEIKVRFFEGSQRAKNCLILENTVEMLNEVDKHRQFITSTYRKKKRMRFLTIHCKPIRWIGYKSKPIEMTTVKTQRAREYKSIYDSLNNNDVTVEERIELLILLKNSLKKHNCYATTELVYLLDQEIMLLSRGIKCLLLNYLRERVLNAFLYFVSKSNACSCEGMDKNSDCMNLREPLETNVLLCRGCLKLLPYHKFSTHVRMKRISHCKSCTWLHRGRGAHINYDPYMFLLNDIRAHERKRSCFSNLVYIVQARDIYHLVNNIWHGHSIVSENDDLFKLRLVRFYIHEEWAPWNCILLTEEEAETHRYIENFAIVYSKHLLHKIFLAHEIAKSHFRNLMTFEKKCSATP